MVLLVEGMHLDESPRDLRQFFLQFPHFKDVSNAMCAIKPQIIGPIGLIYVLPREYSVTYPHDNKISILGTDDVTTGHIVIIRHTGSGATALAHVDRVYEEGMAAVIQRVQALSYHYDGRLELHIIGGFSDSKGISHNVSIALLHCLHKFPRIELDLVTCCIGELCTIRRNGTPWPLIYGVGINVKTGDVFSAVFTDKGPDLDIRNARTLTGGENVGMLEIYDCSREELRIGPFSYEPMRAVDIWLQQTDEFLIQSLSSSPEVTPPQFVSDLRSTLKRIKDDPYPAVTLFHNNLPRYYRKDVLSGQWTRYQKEEIVNWPSTSLTMNSAQVAYY